LKLKCSEISEVCQTEAGEYTQY